MRIQRILFAVMLPQLIATVWCSAARADGGAVRVVEKQHGYQISVFTAPHPLVAGPVDVSILLQDVRTLEPVRNSTVTVIATPRDQPSAVIHCAATSEAATNKLFRAAQFQLPQSGWWDVEVICQTSHDDARVQFAMETGTPLGGWLAVWPWFSWPIVPVLLFAMHQWLARR